MISTQDVPDLYIIFYRTFSVSLTSLTTRKTLFSAEMSEIMRVHEAENAYINVFRKVNKTGFEPKNRRIKYKDKQCC